MQNDRKDYQTYVALIFIADTYVMSTDILSIPIMLICALIAFKRSFVS